MRILVVEDEHDLAEALAVGLRREGYAVDLAGDGDRDELGFLQWVDDFEFDVGPVPNGLDQVAPVPCTPQSISRIWNFLPLRTVTGSTKCRVCSCP